MSSNTLYAVYVLVSNKEDYYFEQFAISAYSLKLHSPHMKITLVVDSLTAKTIDMQRSYIYKYVNNIIEVDCPRNFNNICKSRFIKTSLRSFVDGDYIFIDSDTIVVKPLESIYNYEGDVLAVPDKHLKMADHPDNLFIANDLKTLDVNIDDRQYYINSGVILVRDTPLSHSLYKAWHKYWIDCQMHGVYRDQPALAKANYELGNPIKLLPHTWNCQIAENGLKYMTNAFIIHYFASNKIKGNKSNPYLLHDVDLYAGIRKRGEITEEVIKLCNNPFSAFRDDCKIISGIDIKFLEDNPFIGIMLNYPKIYIKLVGIVNFIYKLKKKL